MQTDPSKSTNDLSRRIISQVKKVVEHVNKSSRSKVSEMKGTGMACTNYEV